MPVFLALSLAPLLLFALIAILNALTFPRLRAAERRLDTLPLVSVLVPIRNEAGVIGETLRSLLAQTYPNFEVLVLDDQSTDGCADEARAAGGGDPRLRVLSGKALPTGWTGKVWACHQLSEQAAGDFLLFTDADVRWQPDALMALVSEAQRTQADLLTVWPTQITVTWSERLVVPLMAFSILAYLPVLAVHHLSWPVFSAAMGQCLLFRRNAYQQVGGHASISDRVLDDMAFAYTIKRHRLRLRMADGNGLIQTRMYRNWQQVRDGFGKNILAGHGNSVFFLLLSTVFHWWLFIVPWGGLAVSLFSRQLKQTIEYVLWVALALLTRALTAAVSRQRLRDALLLPVSVFSMTLIVFRALDWHFRGGPEWKSRRLSR
ncbi:MAG: glycosyltransferase [Anaerolineales bacterium]|nr:glycosyltransferase [Anaerolineales bacterium]MCX7754107.1 glycosyltransferase [Anaerolineales bacterium]MDW8278810.1 glycosyltransferase [Anaerolineales bacterium]